MAGFHSCGSSRPRRLDNRTRDTIKDWLFEEWLADRRRANQHSESHNSQ